MKVNKIAVVCLSLMLLLTCAPWCINSEERLLVNMTLVRNASALGAYCLDGSLPAYHLHRGFGAGARNWLLQFEGGGWCNDIQSCLGRAKTRRGSTRYMNKLEVFSGILSNNASRNPDFYNWNRVKLRYCDGASFAGDAKFYNGNRHHCFTSEGKGSGRQSFMIFSPRAWGVQKRHYFQGVLLEGWHLFCTVTTSLVTYRGVLVSNA